MTLSPISYGAQDKKQPKQSLHKMKVDVLLGLQWGDEGKGKVVDVLTPRYDAVARFQGGPNAGHTLEFEVRSMCCARFLRVSSRMARPIS